MKFYFVMPYNYMKSYEYNEIDSNNICGCKPVLDSKDSARKLIQSQCSRSSGFTKK